MKRLFLFILVLTIFFTLLSEINIDVYAKENNQAISLENLMQVNSMDESKEDIITSKIYAFSSISNFSGTTYGQSINPTDFSSIEIVNYGGLGANAIEVEKVTIENYGAELTIVGGNGGKGGKGGPGELGTDGEWFGNSATDGGRGGTGGAGGLGGFAAAPVIINLELNIVNASLRIGCSYDMLQGYGGDGGPGGTTIFGNQRENGPTGHKGAGTNWASSILYRLNYIYPNFDNTAINGNYQTFEIEFDYSTW